MEFIIEFIRPVYSLAPFESKKASVCLCAEDLESAKALFETLFKNYHYRIERITCIDYRPLCDM